jgi:hypothetical protein
MDKPLAEQFLGLYIENISGQFLSDIMSLAIDRKIPGEVH